MGCVGQKEALERAGFWGGALGCSPATYDESVGPDGLEPSEPKLAGLEEAFVDLDFEDPPVETADRRDAIPKKIFVIKVLRLKVVLAYEQPFSPDWLTRHQSRPGEVYTRARRCAEGRSPASRRLGSVIHLGDSFGLRSRSLPPKGVL
jgi:hypothetical protein